MWNASVFAGMNRKEVLAFKKRHKKLILEQYKLNKQKEALEVKQATLNKKVACAKAGEVKSARNTAVKVAIGGVFVATVVASNQISAMQADSSAHIPTNTYTTTVETVASSDVAPTVEKVYIPETTPTIKDVATESPSELVEVNVTMDEITSPVTQADSTISTEIVETETQSETEFVEVEVTTDEITSSVVQLPSEAVEEDMNDCEVEEDFIIFDQAIEMGIEMCDKQFDNHLITKEVYVLDVIEKSKNPMVQRWFEMLLDTNVNNETLAFDVSYIAPAGSVRFESREGRFFADIDSSKIEARVNFNLQKAINDSIKSGVDESVRHLLFNNTYIIVEDLINSIALEIEQELVKSGAYLAYVKSDISEKLTHHTTWDVEATIL